MIMNRFKKIRKMFVNDAQRTKMIQCRTVVEAGAVRRELIDGVEHIIISSKTLPDDVVMNGGLYPADEILKGFSGLDRTLAPLGHPTNANGDFIPASDPDAIHNFHAGAFNSNVRQENGRVVLDKVVNVQEAMKSDRGRRLLDRISELETNPDARPVHTSVGLYLNEEVLDEPRTNAEGQKYTWVARNMVFDHDAILLDKVGAAQPHQGVGMAVNGDKIDVEQVNVSEGELSHSEIRDSLNSALSTLPFEDTWVNDIIADEVIFWSNDQLFSASFIIEDRQAKIVSVPVEIERVVTYTPKTNHKGDAMKELILNALAAANIKTVGLSDDELFAEYNALQATQNPDAASADGDTSADTTAAAVAAALEPVMNKLGDLEAKINSTDEKELVELAELIGNSDKYSGIDADAARKLGAETLKTMAANCQSAFGIPLHVSSSKDDESYDMPK